MQIELKMTFERGLCIVSLNVFMIAVGIILSIDYLCFCFNNNNEPGYKIDGNENVHSPTYFINYCCAFVLFLIQFIYSKNI